MYTNPSQNNVMAQRPDYSFLNVDPFPFTNANFDDPLNMPSMDEDEGYDLGSSYSKKPLSKDERRAEHNAIERARRESLNNKFQQLAQALPNLMNYRRPSKSQIVEKALDWVKKSISREERYRYQILQLQKENKQLLTQLTGTSMSTPTVPMTTTNVTSPIISPSASVSTPTTTTTSNNKTHPSQYSPHTSISSPAETSPLTSLHHHHHHQHQHQRQQHHSFSDLATTNTTASTTSMSALQSPFLYDMIPSSLLTNQSPPPPPSSSSSSTLTTPHIFSSLDDLHHPPSSYDRKEFDPALFQSPPTDLYLESMLLSNSNHRLPPSPGFIQPMASRSTPAFSSSRRR